MSTPSTDYVSFWEFFQSFIDCQRLALPLKKAHEEICHSLQAVVLGEVSDYKFVVINVMPRMGKTKILEALHAWTHAYFPEAQIITVSYSAELAERSVKYVTGVLQEKWYRESFPNTRLGATQKSDQYTTTKNGSLYCAGVGGTILGFGAGLKGRAGGYISVDDASNPKEVLSKDVMEKLRLWFEGTLLSRRNSDKFTPVIVIAQRLHEDDLCGYILKEYAEQTLHLCYPALINDVSQYPETISTETLLKMRNSSGLASFAFEAMYNQNPKPMGGNLIKIDDFRRHNLSELGTEVNWEVKILVADTAMKETQSADRSVIQCWGRKDKKYYLLDMIAGKWTSPGLLMHARNFWKKHHLPGRPLRALHIEDKASGIGLLQQFQRHPEFGVRVQPIKVGTKDKVERMNDVLPHIAGGAVFIPEDNAAPWVKDFLAECASFRADGKSTHDDIVDALAHGLSVLGGSSITIYDVLMHEYQKARRGA